MSLNPHNPRVAFSVTNCICFDQRVQKMAEIVEKLNCEVTIIGRRKGNCCDSGSVRFRTHRFSMIFRKGPLFYKFFNIRLFFYLLFHKYDMLVANDLDTLLPNYLASKLKGVPLVYDSHEYFTGVPELQNRHFVKGVWKSIEEWIFPKLKYVITVSDSIADQYENEYGIRPVTVRNCSPDSGRLEPYSRNELGVNDDHLLAILQGTGINISRGGDELIEALSLTEKVFLLIIGSGDSMEFLKSRVAELNVNERVRFIDSVPWKELMRYTKSADVGLSLDKNNNDNYRFSLPNKIFDYINAGIPVIAGYLPEVNKVISENNCGIIIKEVTPENISEAFLNLINDPEKLKFLKRNASIASKSLNWDTESKKINNIYSELIMTARLQDRTTARQ